MNHVPFWTSWWLSCFYPGPKHSSTWSSQGLAPVSGHLEPGSDPHMKDKDCSMEQGGLSFLLLPKPQAPTGLGKGRGDLSAGLTLLRPDGTCSDTVAMCLHVCSYRRQVTAQMCP